MKPPGSNLDLDHSNGVYWIVSDERGKRHEDNSSCRFVRCCALTERPE